MVKSESRREQIDKRQRRVRIRRTHPYKTLLKSKGYVNLNHINAGAPAGIRTPNLLIRSQMLYPLSYGRKVLSDRKSSDL